MAAGKLHTRTYTIQVELFLALHKGCRYATSAPPNYDRPRLPIRSPQRLDGNWSLKQRTRYRPLPPQRSRRAHGNFCPSNQFKKSLFVLPMLVFNTPQDFLLYYRRDICLLGSFKLLYRVFLEWNSYCLILQL